MGNDGPMTTGLASHATPAERAAVGTAARKVHPRGDHAEWSPTTGRTDPLAILALQATTRVPELVPIRYGRMAVSAFTFFRGAAAVMATDLASVPDSGLVVQLCGDAHLSNFGGFASPERDIVFDVNDFDETLPGPFEWDLKRLAASLEVAGRGRNFSAAQRRQVVTDGCRSYRQSIREFAQMSNLDIWYSRLDAAMIAVRWGSEVGRGALANLERTVTKAKSKDHLKAFTKLTHEVDGELRFLSDPPLLVPATELFSDMERQRFEETIVSALRSYRKTLSGDRRRLVETYQFVDIARKVVGVGSVGTRCWVALLIGRDEGDPLFLQVKQAEAAVIEPFVAKCRFTNQGQRVVEGQRLMQATSDILLGWDRSVGPDGVTRDFYMRQLWDWKASANIDGMKVPDLSVYAQMCGWTLARAHARSGDAIAIGAYLGSSDRFDTALGEFAVTYADQNERDHQALLDAIAAGTIEATSGV